MANGIDNLIPNSERSPNEVRENGRKGGIASGVARRKKRDLREACLARVTAWTTRPQSRHLAI